MGTFHLQPMQIDTKNRHYNGTDFKADILPRSSAAPPNASYSGLLECPCTTRINKTYSWTYSTANTGLCPAPVNNAKQCIFASGYVDPEGSVNATFQEVNSTAYPSYCSF